MFFFVVFVIKIIILISHGKPQLQIEESFLLFIKISLVKHSYEVLLVVLT